VKTVRCHRSLDAQSCEASSRAANSSRSNPALNTSPTPVITTTRVVSAAAS
jgi:hypothetical protein